MNRSFPCLASCLIALMSLQSAEAAPNGSLVPGTGTWIEHVGDDFEDLSWGFIDNFPKSSREQDARLRSPTGRSTNGRWIEGPERGQPDLMEVVPTPYGGLEGSDYALLFRTLNSGVPGQKSYDVQQDDLISSVISRIGMSIPAADMPSAVVRVYLPPAEEWENRTGPHFGFRISTSTVATKSVSNGFFGSISETKAEPYWPGIWIHFRSETSRKIKEDSAFLTVRGNRNGRDFRAKEIPAYDFGWWTFGMSVTPNGMVHYYARKGVEDLTAEDHLTSQYPYGYSALRFRTFFFNACNKNDGQTWSTPFVIDDPQLYLVNPTRVANNMKRKAERDARRLAKKNVKKKQSARKKTSKKRR